MHPRRPAVRRAARGFSLIELMLGLVIFGFLFAIVPPAYRDWIASQQLANHAHFMVNTLELARSVKPDAVRCHMSACDHVSSNARPVAKTAPSGATATSTR